MREHDSVGVRSVSESDGHYLWHWLNQATRLPRTVLTHGPDGHFPGVPTSIGVPIPHANPCPVDGMQLLLS